MNRPVHLNGTADGTADGTAADAAAKPRFSVMEGFLWLSIALGAVLRSLWVGKRELWYDEVLSVLLSSGQKNAYKLPDNTPFAVTDISSVLSLPTENGVAGALETVKNLVKGTLGDPHPPLFYLGEHAWMRLFGNGEGALRSLVMLGSLVALLVSYTVGKRVLGPRGGLIFTALLALNPFFFSHSLNLRMYAPMVLWVLVSAGCFFTLVGLRFEHGSLGLNPVRGWRHWLLRGGMAIALTAGLLTQYLFAYWLFALAALVLYVDRKHWFQHGLTIGASVLLFLPWVGWGVRQQINNRSDVLNQISSSGGPFQAMLAHGKDLAQTLANHLLLGHLTTSMLPTGDPIKPTAVAIGCGVISFLALCIVGLYRRRQYKVLMVTVLMGLVPLAVALGIDIAANKYTLGFGWGRSAMVALPGCLLLVAAWLELGTGRWRTGITAGLLAVYLVVTISDFAGRDRQMFHQLGQYLPETDEPALVVMNSRAWGNVLRLVYYLDDGWAEGIDVLVSDPAKVTESLTAALDAKPYRTVLWLNAEYPLWGVPESPAEAEAFTAQTEALLQASYPPTPSTPLPVQLQGTMNLDRFTLKAYYLPLESASK